MHSATGQDSGSAHTIIYKYATLVYSWNMKVETSSYPQNSDLEYHETVNL